MEKTKEQDCQRRVHNKVQQAHGQRSAKSKMDREKDATFQPKPVSPLLFKQTMQILLTICHNSSYPCI